MYEELEKLILFIQQNYNNLLKEWENSNLYIPINLRKKMVKDINGDSQILNTILNYRSFINTNNLEFNLALNKLNLSYTYIF